MPHILQYGLVALIIAAATAYLVRLLWRWIRHPACGGCGSANDPRKAVRVPLTIGATDDES